jgi:hypothetical protein
VFANGPKAKPPNRKRNPDPAPLNRSPPLADSRELIADGRKLIANLKKLNGCESLFDPCAIRSSDKAIAHLPISNF